MKGPRTLSAGHYGISSLRYHWRVNVAVALGVVAGTAVLTGALIVGDSVRYSLHRLTVERLGAIDEVLLADHFFSLEMVRRLELTERPLTAFPRAVPLILLSQTTMEKTGDESNRASQVTVVGSGNDFWSLSETGVRPELIPTGRKVVLNEPLARDLGAKVGDRVVLRLPKAQRIAGDSPLGEKSDRVENLAELEVVEVLPATGLGRFSLQANQALPRTAFLSTEMLQQALEQPDRINAIVFAGLDPSAAPTPEQVAELQERIRPSLADAGLQLHTVALNYWPATADQPKPVFRYLSLSTETMMFPAPAEDVIRQALDGLTFQTVLTYLANSIAVVGAASDTQIPYSTVSAVDPCPPLTPLVDEQGEPLGPLADDEVVLNTWAAEDLNAEPGDRIRLAYFAPETTHGEAVEETVELTLKAIAPLQQPETPYSRRRPARYTQPPYRANDPDLTPQVPGITDQESIDDWDPPFPFDYGKIRQPVDEDYWDQFRTTPKAFVNKHAGESLWGSRFGDTTSFRIELRDESTQADVERRLTEAIGENLAGFGFSLLHVKQDGLRAARGTTPFNALFLGFSLFLIAAALMLVCLLFRLSLEQRMREAGVLLAMGLNQKQVSRLFLVEAALITLLGVICGALLGIGYAALMILGLQTWWLDAVVTPFLELHVGKLSLVWGAVLGAVASLLTIRLTVASLQRRNIRDLLTRNAELAPNSHRPRRRFGVYLALVLWGVAIVAGVAAVFLGGEAQAGAFFAAGASVLTAILLQVSWWLKRPIAVKNLRRHGFSLRQMVIRNLGRNSGRSTLTLGLMATACFLIVAISAFRLRPTEEGTGGFETLAQSDIPLFHDLNDPAVRSELFGSDADRLAGVEVFALRMQDGDDASCRNLYQAQRPRLLGITPQFISYFDQPNVGHFGWAATAEQSGSQASNPWHLINRESSDAIPVMLDKNTAMYSLHLYRGIGEEFELDYGPSVGKLRFQVVGLLSNSIFQGALLISEERLLQQFPAVSGYRYFLLKSPADRSTEVRHMLANSFRDQGWESIDTQSLLADLLAVQNTYLSTFQSLGGLGLLLGTLGLVAVQLRNVFERRAELALLRAAGFSQRRLSGLVLSEHLLLLIGGLGIGVVAALVAVLPHSWTTDVRPPWITLAAVLGTILVVGVLTGYAALRPSLNAPIMDALKRE